jgi:phenylacetic acid degradation operon negative regulatory protein
MPRGGLIDTLMQDLNLTAAGFIVTIYGDVVLPRGGVLWMGSLIALCERVGIKETLVRTAVSRLVTGNQLKGERVGRRSYYRLSPGAQAEFAEVADRLYAPLWDTPGWYVLYGPAIPEGRGRNGHMVKLAGDVWIAPDLGEAPPHSEIVFRADVSDAASLQKLAAIWDLSDLGRRYQAFIDRFSALGKVLDSEAPMPATDALVARLLLVHVYRGALLRDPCLPRSVLPPDWAGTRAHDLFIDLYRQLSLKAATAVPLLLEGEAGPLPDVTSDTKRRNQRLT